MKVFSASLAEQERTYYAILKRINREAKFPLRVDMEVEEDLSNKIKDEDNNLLDPYTTKRICHQVDSMNRVAFYWLRVKLSLLSKLYS